MKRIVFLLKSIEDIRKRGHFVAGMLIKGVGVYFEDIESLRSFPEGTLYVTDSRRSFDKLKERGIEALVYIREIGEMDEYKDARYFALDVFDTELDYFQKVYKRIHEIPWEPVSTKRLVLRETTVKDVDDFYEMYKDKRMTLYMEDLYEDIEEERKYAIEYRDKVYYTQGFGIWTVVRKSDGTIIGRAGLTAREGFSEYEVGFAIGTKYQGQGYGIEAVMGVMKYAKENDLGDLIALVMEGNERSEKLLKKAGFEPGEKTTLNGTEYVVWRAKVANVNLVMI